MKMYTLLNQAQRHENLCGCGIMALGFLW